MITNTAVFSKTPKGIEEITRRTHNLAARLRTTLLLIDGHTPWQDVQNRLPVGLEAEEAIRVLVQEGYIQPTQSSH